MALNKYESMRKTMYKAISTITENGENWRQFLDSAAYLYKYSFREQIAIYAQRPDATAVAALKVWNEKLGRTVKRGSTGIAIPNTQREGSVRYVFDVTDTEPSYGRKNPDAKDNFALWSMEDRKKAVMSSLAWRYKKEENFAGQIFSATYTEAERFYEANSKDVQNALEKSKIAQEFADPGSRRSAFIMISALSAEYMVNRRCGEAGDGDEQEMVNQFIGLFDRPDAVFAMGNAVSYAGNAVLRQIEKVVRSHSVEKQQQVEVEKNTGRSLRDNENEEHNEGEGLHIHGDQRDAVPEHQDVPGRGMQEYGQVRPVEVQVPVQKMAAEVGSPTHGGELVEASETDGSEGRSNGSPSDAEGRADERTSSAESHERTDLHERRLTSQKNIDQLLRVSGQDTHSRKRIAVEYQKGKTPEEIIATLKTEYKGGYGLNTDDGELSAWFADDGIHLAFGKAARYRPNADIIPWKEVAERIGQLMENGNFVTNVELEEAPYFERKELAQSILYLYRDLSEKGREGNYLNILHRDKFGGFPDETAQLTEQLTDPQFRSVLTQQYSEFLTAYEQDHSLMRFSFHKFNAINVRLHELELPRKKFQTTMTEISTEGAFITEDEVDYALSGGSNIEGGKARIYEYFTQEHSMAEKADFLKNEYGIGGHSHALSGVMGSYEEYDAKGIRLNKSNCEPEQLKWANVAKRVDYLVRQGRYFSAEALEQYKASQQEKREKTQDQTTNTQSEQTVETESATVDKQGSLPESETATSRHVGEKLAQADEQPVSEETTPAEPERGKTEGVSEIDENKNPESKTISNVEEGRKYLSEILAYPVSKNHIWEEIVVYFKNHVHLMTDDAAYTPFLREHFGDVFTEFFAPSDQERIGFHGSDAGLEIWKGNYLTASYKETFRWGDIAAKINDLIFNEQDVERNIEKKNEPAQSVEPAEPESQANTDLPYGVTRAELDYAKELINNYCQEEFENEADFSDLSKISIAYTTVEDDVIPIQVYANLVDFRIERYLHETLIENRQYESLEALIHGELEDLEFSDLTYVSDEQVAMFYKQEEQLAPEEPAPAEPEKTAEPEPDTDTSRHIGEKSTQDEEQLLRANGMHVWHVGFNGGDQTEVNAKTQAEAVGLAYMVAMESGLNFSVDYVEQVPEKEVREELEEEYSENYLTENIKQNASESAVEEQQEAPTVSDPAKDTDTSRHVGEKSTQAEEQPVSEETTPAEPEKTAESETDKKTLPESYRYYSTQRPVSPGSYPKTADNAPTKIYNFDDRQLTEGGFMAWGYLEYTKPLTLQQQEEYELTTLEREKYIYEREANPNSTSMDDRCMVRVYEKQSNGTMTPGDILYIGSPVDCRKMIDQLREGTISQTNLRTRQNISESAVEEQQETPTVSEPAQDTDTSRHVGEKSAQAEEQPVSEETTPAEPEETAEKKEDLEDFYVMEALVGENGIFENADKEVVSGYFRNGWDDERVAKRLFNTYDAVANTFQLLNGEEVTYSALEEGFRVVAQNQTKVYSWLEVATTLRGMWQMSTHGFFHGEEQFVTEEKKEAPTVSDPAQDTDTSRHVGEKSAQAEKQPVSEETTPAEPEKTAEPELVELKEYVPFRPAYGEGDMVYLNGYDEPYIIKEVTSWNYVRYKQVDGGWDSKYTRTEIKSGFNKLLLADERNRAIIEFLTDEDTSESVLKGVAGNGGLLNKEEKKHIADWIRNGMGNTEIGQRLAETHSGQKDIRMDLDAYDTAGWSADQAGFELKVNGVRRPYIKNWEEVARIVRRMYRDETYGFSQDFPNMLKCEGIVTYQKGDKVILPYQGYVIEGNIVDIHDWGSGNKSIKISYTRNEENSQTDTISLNADIFEHCLRRDLNNSKLFLPESKENFRIDDNQLGVGTPTEKYQRNIAAIEVLKKIESEGRKASVVEQKTLSQYVGWGSLPEYFDEKKYQNGQIKKLLDEKEYEAARASTLNAHYTSPVVIKAIYKAVEEMGFETGKILEPSMGVGNFFGLLPDNMAGSELHGVELDSISGRIAQQLYPNADIKVEGYEETDWHDYFDLAVGNVPFGQYQIDDKAYNHLKFSIHNYFFAKALDQVRPGGIVAFITSRYTMDAKNPEVRRYLAQRAELLGAIRLPNNAFKANAGTEVVSDIIFLQKRERPIEIEPDWMYLGKTEEGYEINSYFVQNPEMVLGILTSESTQYGKEECTVRPQGKATLRMLLDQAVRKLPKDIYTADNTHQTQEVMEDNGAIEASADVPNNSYVVVNDKIYYKTTAKAKMLPYTGKSSEQSRCLGMIGIRDCVREIIRAQNDGCDDATLANLQNKLNQLYDAYVEKWGYLSDRLNRRVFEEDCSLPLLVSLEETDSKGKVTGKTDFFSKRTIRHVAPVTHCDTAEEALAVSLNESGKVRIGRIAQLVGKSESGVIKELEGHIYCVPGTDNYVLAEEYLSGNVRWKLEEARLVAKMDESYQVNVEALEKVQPVELRAEEIDLRLGATWISPHYIDEFVKELLKVGLYHQRHVSVEYETNSGEWHIEGKSILNDTVLGNTTYGTSRMGAGDIIERTLNLRDVKVYDTIKVDYKEKRVMNGDETVAARAKQELIQTEFQDWIFKDVDRRNELVTEYNRRFNSYRNRSYDGSHLTFPGMSPEVTLREHQINAVARGLYGGNTLLAHVVGAGKTFEVAAIAMESKRIGLCHKSMIVVPNHLTEQWGTEFLRLYPAANVLVATEKDFSTQRRKEFCTRIATGDWDAIIIGHSQFERIPLTPEQQEEFIQEQIDNIQTSISIMKAKNGEKWSIKAMERSKKSLQMRLTTLQNKEKSDDAIYFEDLGVDRIFVDEAQAYKNLFIYTKMQNVAGISQSESQRAFDLYQKCRYMDRLTDGRGVIFATGTPISNSMVEMYTMQRYLQYDRLEETGLEHFDAWAATFGETVTGMELAPEGTGYRSRTRFAKFHNLPELMNMFKEVADIKTAEDLDLDVPTAHHETIVAKRSDTQAEMVEELSKRATAIRNGLVDSSEDNMLKITSDGRKIGLDQRLIDPKLPDEAGSKVNLAVDNILRIWKKHRDTLGTQLVFCDFSTPTDPKKFNVYSDMKAKLIAKGIPEKEIAFIHDAKTKKAKKELFESVNEGKVRILFGSTEKMGAGTNCQERLIALHDIDCPWRPGDLEQRAGRIVRQGNKNKDVYIYRYVTDATFDAYLYQTVENKQKFISQIMTSKTPVRTCEDVDESVLSYAEIKALCAGNPLIKERMELDTDLTRLKMLRSNYQKQQWELQEKVQRDYPCEIRSAEDRIKSYEKDIENYNMVAARFSTEDNNFPPFQIDGNVYDNRENAGKALMQQIETQKGLDPVQVGSWYGLKISIKRNNYTQDRTFSAIITGAASYTVELGNTPTGNITRIENAIKGIPNRMNQTKTYLSDLKKQLETAQEEIKKPWPYEQEFKDKTCRLTELDVKITLDDDVFQESGDRESKEMPETQENLDDFDDRLDSAAETAKQRNGQRKDKGNPSNPTKTH